MVAAIHKLPEHALCAGCNYPLRALTEYRCPECGREFDPDDPESINLGPPLGAVARRLMRPIGWAWLTLITAAVLAMLWSAAQPVHRATDGRILFALLFAGVGIALLWMHHLSRQLTIRHLQQPDRDRDLNMRRRSRILTAILVLAVSIAFNLPLRAGFLISRPWFDQLAQRARACMGKPPELPPHRWVGIYRVDLTLCHVRRNGDVVLVLHDNPRAMFVQTQFGGDPDEYSDQTTNAPLAHQYGHLIGSWYWQN